MRSASPAAATAATRSSTGTSWCSTLYLMRNAKPTKRITRPTRTMVLPPVNHSTMKLGFGGGASVAGVKGPTPGNGFAGNFGNTANVAPGASTAGGRGAGAGLGPGGAPPATVAAEQTV